ncbi:MAG TPA: AMP-binding protein [Deltaproteobacteria bacterium]|nr:AMP-binding protein [Deltaproteobacteria bacterium]
MTHDRIWVKSYDPGLTDLDPAEWEKTYPEVCLRAFRDFPDKTALAFMGVHISFADLDRYANRFATMLLAHGFTKGDVVGINLPNIPEYVITWLGTLRAGCVVSGVSPLLSKDEMAYQLKDSRARGLVTLDAIFSGRLVHIAPDLPDLKLVVATSVGGFLPGMKRFLGKALKKIPSGKVTPLPDKAVHLFRDAILSDVYPDTPPRVDLRPDDIAYIQYTGGTTGDPKGAMLSHRNFVADILIFQHWLGWEPGSSIGLSGFPFFHIAGLFTNANCIYLGWTQILIPNPRDTNHICKELKRYQPTVMANVPSLYMLLMANPAFKELDHSRLETCICAAAPFPEEAQRQFEAIIGRGKLVEAYGMTETSPLTVVNPVKGAKKLGSIGVPLLNTEVRLIEPGTDQEVKPGQPGEICVRGPQVMVGYYNRPEETRRVIDEDGFMHTGDVAVMDEDGFLRIVDRTKDMIIVGGFKVFSRKVEDVLIEHPAIATAATIGIPNPERPGSEVVKAYITLDPEKARGKDQEALRDEILDYARQRLAPYEVPKIVEFRDELPLTTVGKIDKKVLRRESGGAGATPWGGGDRRANVRKKVDLACGINGISEERDARIPGHVVDVSSQGMGVEISPPLDEGMEVDAEITVMQFGTTLWVRGKVLTSRDNRVSIRFSGSIPKEIEDLLTL